MQFSNEVSCFWISKVAPMMSTKHKPVSPKNFRSKWPIWSFQAVLQNRNSGTRGTRFIPTTWSLTTSENLSDWLKQAEKYRLTSNRQSDSANVSSHWCKNDGVGNSLLVSSGGASIICTDGTASKQCDMLYIMILSCLNKIMKWNRITLDQKSFPLCRIPASNSWRSLIALSCSNLFYFVLSDPQCFEKLRRCSDPIGDSDRNFRSEKPMQELISCMPALTLQFLFNFDEIFRKQGPESTCSEHNWFKV